jgi:hypothetical protein
MPRSLARNGIVPSPRAAAPAQGPCFEEKRQRATASAGYLVRYGPRKSPWLVARGCAGMIARLAAGDNGAKNSVSKICLNFCQNPAKRWPSALSAN